MQNAKLDETQTGIKIARRNNSNLRYADDTTLMAESKEELKSLLMKERRVKKLAQNSTFSKLRSWDMVPSLHDKQLGKHGNSERLYFWGVQNH